MDLQARKKQVAAEVDRLRDELVDVAAFLHAHPETGRSEYKACRLLSERLKAGGFEVIEGLAGMPTAFIAGAGPKDAPGVAFLAEYDALPELGHACGHNLIAAMTLGAGLAVRSILAEAGGRVLVVGSPDEEDAGGKIALTRAGIFDGLAAAMIVHPGAQNQVTMNALAAVGVTARFRGRAAHAAAEPHKGVNALDGLIMSFNGINALRQHLRDDVRIHGIVTRGGSAPNIVPDLAEGRFILRARHRAYLDEVRRKVSDVFNGARICTGTTLELEWQDVFDDMRSNARLGEAFRLNYEQLGLDTFDPDANDGLGSTDMGNVSHAAPAIHAMIAIAPPSVMGHTPDFARAAVSKAGYDAMVAGAKAMAMTAVDIWRDRALREEIAAEFNRIQK